VSDTPEEDAADELGAGGRSVIQNVMRAGLPVVQFTRNRFEGVITSVEVTGVIAQVEMESGGNHIVSVITRDAVEELGLAPGVRAVATVKATSVMVARL